jgi:hypothetical protein
MGAAACGGSVKGGDGPGPVDVAPPSCSPTCTPTSLGSLSIAKGGLVALETDGSPTTLATIPAGYNNSLSLAVEGGNVYFAGGSDVGSVPTGGGSVTTIVSNETQATNLVATASSLYWEDGFAKGGTPGASGTLHGVAIGGAAVDSIASDQPLYYTMATDGTSLYWSDLDGVFKLPVAGGAPSNLYGQSVLQIVADGAGIYWANDGAQVGACGVCSAPPPPTSTSSQIFRLPVGGGTPTTLATGYAIDTLAVSEGLLFYFDSYEKTLSQVPTSGGTPAVIASNVTALIGPVVTASAVFWVDGSSEVVSIAR